MSARGLARWRRFSDAPKAGTVITPATPEVTLTKTTKPALVTKTTTIFGTQAETSST